tara:strand:+ start:1228 stop:1548 length:321 start_codon:yes stop_codon:yes gene_type:complete
MEKIILRSKLNGEYREMYLVDENGRIQEYKKVKFLSHDSSKKVKMFFVHGEKEILSFLIEDILIFNCKIEALKVSSSILLKLKNKIFKLYMEEKKANGKIKSSILT